MGEPLNELILGMGVQLVEPVELEESDEEPTGDPAEAVDPVDHDGEDDDLTIREDEPVPGRVAYTVIQPVAGVSPSEEGES
jgi:hypothetical protein